MQRVSVSRSLIAPTVVLGIGLSGFFDGILLHQVLQWHHLLSLVAGEPFRDIGTQILADGLFHVLMYVVTGLGLWLLWRRRAALALPNGTRAVAGGGVLGFGLWNVIDVGFFHWVLGIHRIRVNVPDPMLYDLGWFVVLGIVPLAIGGLLLRGGTSSPGRHGVAAAVVLAFLASWAAWQASLPPPNTRTALVLFAPGASPGTLINAALAAGTTVVWIDPRGRMMAVSLDRPTARRLLYRSGALFVARSSALAGCAAALSS
jgi:uncharacterized membrane protein